MSKQELSRGLRRLVIVLGIVSIPIGRGYSQDPTGPEPSGQEEMADDRSRITDEVIPLQLDDVPDRPRSLLEIGNPYLHPGEIGEGFTLPTGAVWQPSLLVFGTYRTGVNIFDRGDTISEWANKNSTLSIAP